MIKVSKATRSFSLALVWFFFDDGLTELELGLVYVFAMDFNFLHPLIPRSPSWNDLGRICSHAWKGLGPLTWSHCTVASVS